MSQPPVYLGLDVHKATLVGSLAGADFTLDNHPRGRAALCAWIQAHPSPVQVVCEASGGYERGVVEALRQAGLPVSVLHPTRARQLAKGLGHVAKNDRLDAVVLAKIGSLLTPAPTVPALPEVSELAALVSRRDQLVELIRREKHHHETATLKVVLCDLARNLAALQKRLEKIEGLIAKHLLTHPALAQKAQRLQQASGVGLVGAVTLLAALPELGTGSRARISSLAGLAPRDRDSGQYRGSRHVHGGRPKVRRILYLCALSAVRHSPPIHAFYLRLRSAGKPPKLALLAAARKLLTYLHAALKNPNFKLA
jgi:transposase